MCELRQNGKHPISDSNVFALGIIYTVGASGEINQTRWKDHKMLCKHKDGEWEDTPELGDNDTLYIEQGTQLMVVRS
jgi:hypothetical protein